MANCYEILDILTFDKHFQTHYNEERELMNTSNFVKSRSVDMNGKKSTLENNIFEAPSLTLTSAPISQAPTTTTKPIKNSSLTTEKASAHARQTLATQPRVETAVRNLCEVDLR